MSIIVLAVTAIWLWDAIKLKEGYVSEIVRSIDNRQLNLDEVQFDVHDAETVETLDKVLNEKDEFKQLLLWIFYGLFHLIRGKIRLRIYS